ncbi:MAG: nucleoside monophosphate kinase [Candidatus Shapirobacteria bacterium]|nr:nucleoside monophosphate kinase [Candidatus Shapirobacteria bacterium]
MKLNLFIIGPSGCGKSTQGRMLSEKYNLIHISMGQLLRDEIAINTRLGQMAKPYIDKGTWVPNKVAINILTKKLDQINNFNFVVDGFPRVLEQGIIIQKYLESKDQKISALFHIDIDPEEIIKRRQLKKKVGQTFSDHGRTDETEEAIAQRFKSYQATIEPILDYFNQEKLLITIDGNQPTELIFNDICQNIKETVKSPLLINQLNN